MTVVDYVDYDKYIASFEWRRKRAGALAHYGASCARCGNTRRLHVHHHTYAHLGDEPFSDLAVLCEPCHARLHKLARAEKLTVEEASARFLRFKEPVAIPKRRGRKARRPRPQGKVEWDEERAKRDADRIRPGNAGPDSFVPRNRRVKTPDWQTPSWLVSPASPAKPERDQRSKKSKKSKKSKSKK